MRKSLMIAISVLTLVVGPSRMIQAESSDTYRQLNLFGDVFELIREEYVDEVDDSKVIESAINGMLSSLDPHSSYMNPESFKEMQVQTRGEFGGLGIQVTLDHGLVKVISPIDDTPAAKAGIMAGDYITALDGQPVMGMSLNDAVDKMRGAVGTSITLTIAREGEESTFDVKLTRAVVTVESVRSHMEDDISYIRITSFTEQTERDLKAALAAASESKVPVKGYILDLRNNPGGLLDQAIAVVDAFLDKGEIVSTRGRYARDTQRYNAHPGDLAKGKPIIVLINGGSASASEIVAGALQDHHRAIILGTQSFGKGSVQTIRPLSNNGAIRLTTARYYTPSGRSIQATGITPDIKVAQATLQPVDQPQLRSEATLPGHLANPNGDDQKPEAKPEQGSSLPPSVKLGPEDDSKDMAQDAKTKDFQLTYALDLLHGLTLISARDSEL